MPNQPLRVQVVLFILLFLLIRKIRCEQKFIGDVHTSAAFIPPLVQIENRIVEKLKKFVEVEGIAEDVIDRYINEWEATGHEDYASNPLNSYHFFKRLVHHFKEVEDVLSGFHSAQVLSELRKLREKLQHPTREDINGAAWAIARLQEVYNLTVEDLIAGKIKGSQAIRGLNADDCLKFAEQSFDNLAFKSSKIWTKYAIKLLRRSQPFTKEHEDKIKGAQELTERRKLMRKLVTTMAKKHGTKLRGKFSGLGVPKSFEKTIYKTGDKVDQVDLLERVFKSLCRGEKLKGLQEPDQPLRFCKLSYGAPYQMTYLPIRIEEVYSKPDIWLFHDVITDSEINKLKNLAYPHLETARVKPYTNVEIMKSIARIGKSAWLRRKNHTLVDSLLKRIEVMTGLTTRYAEELHILNYGVGGHYELHIDFFDFVNRLPVYDKSAFKGDQIATVLFYLNNVEAGGSTVFPYINLGIKPEKGSAVVWYNLHRNGSGNYRTLHASCPVLLGQKWITTLWLNEIGQELRLPCTLDKTE